MAHEARAIRRSLRALQGRSHGHRVRAARRDGAGPTVRLSARPRPMPRRVRATGARDDAYSTDSSAAGSTAGSAAAGRPSDGAGSAARYYPAAGVVLRRLPGALSGRRRRRAAVLQGARLRRVRERGRGDRHVPVLRRGPVTVTAAAAAGGGLLERRGDRPRAFEELGVIYKATIVN